MSTTPDLDWNELDDKAVDTVRVLAMDAVQKVGNGHPGTAMSLAPAAYLLFQKVMRHNPADPHWPGRDRFVLSCGHSSLTLYLQLYLGGWGLELEDIEALRTWGSKTPGHPEYGHTAGVETTTGPLGQGIGNAVGMAMAARRERGLLDPGHRRVAVRPPHLRPLQRRRHRGGRLRRGLGDRRRPAARQPDADLRRQPDLDRGRHQHRPRRGRRRPLRGVRLARAGRRLDPRRQGVPRGRPGAATPRSRRPRRSPTSRASSGCARSSPGRRPTPRTPARRTAPRSAPTRSPRPRRCWASTRRWPSTSTPRSSSTPGSWCARGKAAQAAWDEEFAAWAADAGDRKADLRPDADPDPARRLGRRAAHLRRRREGDGDPQGVGHHHQRHRAGDPRAVGRLRRPRRVQQHDHRGRAVVPARRTARPRCGAATRSWAGCCTSASASTAWARS